MDTITTSTTTEDPTIGTTTTTHQPGFTPMPGMVDIHIGFVDAWVSCTDGHVDFFNKGDICTISYDGDMAHFYGWALSDNYEGALSPGSEILSRDNIHSFVVTDNYHLKIIMAVSYDVAASFGWPDSTTTPQPQFIRNRLDCSDADTWFSSTGETFTLEGDMIELRYDGNLSHFYGWAKAPLELTADSEIISRDPIYDDMAMWPYDGYVYYAVSYESAKSLGYPDSDIPTTPVPTGVARDYALWPTEETIRTIARAEILQYMSASTTTSKP